MKWNVINHWWLTSLCFLFSISFALGPLLNLKRRKRRFISYICLYPSRLCAAILIFQPQGESAEYQDPRYVSEKCGRVADDGC